MIPMSSKHYTQDLNVVAYLSIHGIQYESCTRNRGGFFEFEYSITPEFRECVSGWILDENIQNFIRAQKNLRDALFRS